MILPGQGAGVKTNYIQMKKSFILALVLIICSVGFAQNELIIQSGDHGLYLIHTVTPKENFYSVGRLYNISPKEIASYNSLDMNKGLTIGQVIKIPLVGTNFSQSSASGRPIFYVVGEKEGLYRVSTKNNKVLMASLRKWNHLASDNLTPGKKLIVGYLVSPEANNIMVTNVSSPIAKAPVNMEPPLEVNTKNEAATKKEETIQKREDLQPKQETATINRQPINPPVSNKSTQLPVNDGNGGYFRNQFDEQLKVQPQKADQTLSAGIFKTASGWQDAKYYALIDNVDPGTIVRVINPTNGRAIYAKVLGSMSGVRQNQGFDIRISNAAASALEIADTDKFIVRVVY